MKPIIGISIGDPAGVGPEITLKAMVDEKVNQTCFPIAIGDKKVVKKASHLLKINCELKELTDFNELTPLKKNQIYFVDLNQVKDENWDYGTVDPRCGDAAFNYIKYAIDLALSKKIAAVVTAPINKEAINLAGHHFSGHTEIFAHFTKTKKYRMLLTSECLKVIHVSTHSSIKEMCKMIKKERVYDTIVLGNETLKLMGIEKPRLAVAGFNPHASENGIFGNEEADEIIPAIEKAKEEGIDVVGPISADTVFVKALGNDYDLVVSMYHDQGHIPIKLLGFKMDPITKEFLTISGVNCTVGLPIIRTSVDHGTAFDKAGKGIANENSMVDAIILAAKMAMKKDEKNDQTSCDC